MKSGVAPIAAVAACLALAGCATYQPVPAGYGGPVVTVTDSVISEDNSKAQFFVLEEVDGHPIETSFGATAQASRGRGFALSLRLIERQLPVRPVKVKLYAGHTTGAPIHAVFSQLAGTFFSVEGIVDFSPALEHHYVVKGELKKQGSSVWIEDAETGQLVTEKVVKPN